MRETYGRPDEKRQMAGTASALTLAGMHILSDWLQAGGPLMAPLLVAGAAGLALVIDRLAAVLRRSRINTRPFMERVVSLAAAGKTDEALALCVEHKAVLPDLGLVLLRSRSRDPAELAAIARAACLGLLSELKRRERWLPATTAIVVALGVAGAGVNLHEGLVGDTIAAVRSATRPLVTAMLIAVPLIAGHAIAVDARGKLLDRVEEFSARLVNALAGRPDVRLGHRD
jgi:hypothetical protein